MRDDDVTNAALDAKAIPLAERLRPRVMADFVGQEALSALDEASLKTGSLILWGRPVQVKPPLPILSVIRQVIILVLSAVRWCR